MMIIWDVVDSKIWCGKVWCVPNNQYDLRVNWVIDNYSVDMLKASPLGIPLAYL
jgi:hypothetical protein